MADLDKVSCKVCGESANHIYDPVGIMNLCIKHFCERVIIDTKGVAREKLEIIRKPNGRD